MLIGAAVSPAGGPAKAVARGEQRGFVGWAKRFREKAAARKGKI